MKRSPKKRRVPRKQAGATKPPQLASPYAEWLIQMFGSEAELARAAGMWPSAFRKRLLANGDLDARFAAALADRPDLQGRRLAALADRSSLAFRSNLGRAVFDIRSLIGPHALESVEVLYGFGGAIRDLTSPAQTALVLALVQRGVPVTLFSSDSAENREDFAALVATLSGSLEVEGEKHDLSSLRWIAGPPAFAAGGAPPYAIVNPLREGQRALLGLQVGEAQTTHAFILLEEDAHRLAQSLSVIEARVMGASGGVLRDESGTWRLVRADAREDRPSELAAAIRIVESAMREDPEAAARAIAAALPRRGGSGGSDLRRWLRAALESVAASVGEGGATGQPRTLRGSSGLRSR
jgi:hypothetical protein